MLIYVHIPFCEHKCPYCDFNSHVRKEPEWGRYLAALTAELRWRLQQPQWRGRCATTLYFGGGTPSLAPVYLIAQVLDILREYNALSSGAEISLEANPGSINEGKLAGWRAAGVNRLSIGVQSVDEAQLRWLERIHSADQGVAAVELALDSGWDSVGVDMIYGLPHQSLAQWQQQLTTMMALQPAHLSCYQLTVEEGTPLALRHATTPYRLPGEELAAELLLWTRQQLVQGGWHAYEISNYARVGKLCRHNDGYWRYDDYLAVGAGACGKVDCVDGGVIRYSNRRHPEGYMAQVERGEDPAAEVEYRSSREAAAEAVWLALRRTDGVILSG
ncbi:MAG: radical SAM family heme chaperone HemW, partial [Mariprofundales bacterium]|nr:radical SAM family heme chaperone HemW [Mariprofundales bacterium]